LCIYRMFFSSSRTNLKTLGGAPAPGVFVCGHGIALTPENNCAFGR
jgi:hypothetical protein